MEKSIYKYPLEVTDRNILHLPKDAEILCVQNQLEQPCLWALVNPMEEIIEERLFETFGTGHPVWCDMGIERKYIGTYQMSGGSLVFHVFERIN
jgi:hypothetical protein